MDPVNPVELDKVRFDPATPDQAETEAQREQAEQLDDPLSQTGTFEGKKVFKANELNQAGEDKEYFHPDKDRKFDVPKDANHHALTPDIEVTPDNTIKTIR